MKLDGLYVDIGACKGEEITMALDKGCDVIAFEPHRLAFTDYLQVKFGDNEKVELHNAAAWDKDEEVPFYSHKDMHAFDRGSTIIPAKAKKHFVQQKTVRAINIGKFLKGKKIGTIKIDAEGAEYRIIESLLDNRVSVQHWYVEDHERKIADEEWRAHKRKVLKRVEKNNITLNNWL